MLFNIQKCTCVNERRNDPTPSSEESQRYYDIPWMSTQKYKKSIKKQQTLINIAK